MLPGDQSIFKIHRESRDKYATLENTTIRDHRISFKATGLLCYLLSLPEVWRVSQNHLSTVKTDGRDSVIAGFKELIAAGYIKKTHERIDGVTQGVWHVYEAAILCESDIPISKECESEKPKSEKPITGNPILRSKDKPTK